MEIKDELSLVLNSIRIALKAHKNQFRKDGKTPYIDHVFAVAYSVEPMTPETISVALLHDVIESSTLTTSDLFAEGIPMEIVKTVRLLSRMDVSETYLDYIRKINENEIARAVKLADINNNINDDPSESQRMRYMKALEILRK